SGENGKFRIVELSLSPNPFDPGIEKNQLRLTLDVDAVKGLGGDSKNHRFFALTARAILDPETLETITTIYAASEIARDIDGPVRVTVADEWDGTDGAGQTLEDPKAYPSELSVAVVRLYAGKWNGPNPSLRPGDFLTYEQMSEIMMQVGMFERPKKPDPNMIVEQRSFKRVDVQSPYAFPRYQLQDLVIRGFDPLSDCAPDCDQARISCKITVIEKPNTIVACNECAQNCIDDCKISASNCKWPTGASSPHAYTCNYWIHDVANSFGNASGQKLPFPNGRSDALCFSPNMRYVECPLLSQVREPSALLCYYECTALASPLVTKEFDGLTPVCPDPWIGPVYGD
ncbi:MAG: hypothetical protein CO108_13175, partial [Deltaproteobacteria bacterium CG_4_9_14_3_um_filter_63_12]